MSFLRNELSKIFEDLRTQLTEMTHIIWVIFISSIINIYDYR